MFISLIIIEYYWIFPQNWFTEYYCMSCILNSTDNHCIISKVHWILQPILNSLYMEKEKREYYLGIMCFIGYLR